MTNEDRERLIDEACQRAIAEGKRIVKRPKTGARKCICPLQALVGSAKGYTDLTEIFARNGDEVVFVDGVTE